MQLITPSTYINAGWDFHSIWSFSETTQNATSYGSKPTPVLLAMNPMGTWTGDFSTDWNAAGNWVNWIIPDTLVDITIPAGRSYYPVIDSGTTVKAYKISVNNGATFKISTGGAMTISDSLVNNGTFTLASSASGNGSLIVDTAVSGTGNFIRQQYIPNNDGWHMIASPSLSDTIIGSDFVPAPSGGILGTDFDFYSFNEAVSASWDNIRATGNTVNTGFEKEFDPGKGYLVAYAASYGKTMLNFKGKFNVGDVTTPNLTVTSADTWAGWNLIGNPYTSAIDWNKANKSAFADNFAYVYDPNKAGGAGYVTVDGTTSGALIAPGQGFFVDVNTPGSFTFTHSMQIHHTSSVLKTDAVSNDVTLRLSSGSNKYDETTVRIVSGSDTKRDRTDALQMNSLDKSVPQLWSYTSDSVAVSINSYPVIDSVQKVQMGVYIPSDGSYSISLQKQTGDFGNEQVILEDLSNGTKTNLSQSGNYTFNASKGDSKQFILFVTGTMGINNPTANNTTLLYAYQSRVFIQNKDNSPITGQVKIYNLLGQVVYQKQVSETSRVVLNPNVTTGIYIVRLQDNKGNVLTKKVSISE
ncbi:MAG: T9SS type A sorting domain-containing protein [Bacteroidales bacterium]|nr:T9SS type A sorting domain-containing protein [Bacteroidales bacterium]